MKRRNFLKRQHIHLYKRKRFENPFFQERKIQDRSKRRLAFISVGVVFAAAPVVFLFSPYYRVTDITVDGLTTLEPLDVRGTIESHLDKRTFGILPKHQRPFLRESALAAELQEHYNFASLDVEVKRKSIVVIAEERIVEIIWKSADARYFLDLQGKVIRPLTEEETAIIVARETQTEPPAGVISKLQPTMPILVDASATVVVENTEILSPSTVGHLVTFDKKLRSIGVTPHEYQAETQHPNWYRIKSDKNFDILFDAVAEPAEQLEILNVVLNEKKDELSTAQYVDIRFGNNVYIK